MGFSLPALFTLFQKRLATRKALFCLPILGLMGLYGLAAMQNHELDVELLGVKPEVTDAIVAHRQFWVRPPSPQKTPPLIAVTRWLSSDETKHQVIEDWQKQTHQKSAPSFTLSFEPVPNVAGDRQGGIQCQVSLPNQKTPLVSQPSKMAGILVQLACDHAQESYRKLFGTPPDFNQEYAFHRLHAVETNLSQTLIALSKLKGTSNNGLRDLQIVQQLENSIFYRTMMAVNRDQQHLLNRRYHSILSQIKKDLPLNQKTLTPQSIGKLLNQNQMILALEKTLRLQELQWQESTEKNGPNHPSSKKLAEQLTNTQEKLQKTLNALPVLATRQKRNTLLTDPDNWIPVGFHPLGGSVGEGQEVPAVQLEGAPRTNKISNKIHYRPLSQKEIALLEDLSHLSGSISNARNKQGQARQAHIHSSQAVATALKHSHLREALQEKQFFLEQNYQIWSELASRQALLKDWQTENSTGGLSPVTISYTRPSHEDRPSLDKALNTLPVLDWDLLIHPLTGLLMVTISLGAGIALVMFQKEPLTNVSVQLHALSPEPLAQEAPFEKNLKSFKPAQRSMSAGEVLGKTQEKLPEKSITQWLKETVSASEPSEPKPILTLTIPPIDVEAINLFLATLQDPESLVSKTVREILTQLNVLLTKETSLETSLATAGFKKIMVSGNSLLSGALAIEWSRSQKQINQNALVKTCLLELTQESGLLGYLFQMGEGQMKGCEGLSDLFLEHYTPEVLLKLIENQSGVAALTVLPNQGESVLTFNKQMNGWKKLLPLLQNQQVMVAAPSVETYWEWNKIAELFKPDVLLIEQQGMDDFDLKKLQKSLPQTQLVLLQ